MAWASKVDAVPAESPAAANWDLGFKYSHAEGLVASSYKLLLWMSQVHWKLSCHVVFHEWELSDPHVGHTYFCWLFFLSEKCSLYTCKYYIVSLRIFPSYLQRSHVATKKYFYFGITQFFICSLYNTSWQNSCVWTTAVCVHFVTNGRLYKRQARTVVFKMKWAVFASMDVAYVLPAQLCLIVLFTIHHKSVSAVGCSVMWQSNCSWV
jgi:hypothetical protein